MEGSHIAINRTRLLPWIESRVSSLSCLHFPTTSALWLPNRVRDTKDLHEADGSLVSILLGWVIPTGPAGSYSPVSD